MLFPLPLHFICILRELQDSHISSITSISLLVVLIKMLFCLWKASSIVLFYMCSIYSLFLFGTYGPMTGQTDKLSFGNVTVSLKENWNWWDWSPLTAKFSVFHFSSFFLYICTCNTRDKCTLQDVLYEGNVWREQLLVGKWGLTIE